jgi:predicted nucleic acid-binding protein
MVIVDTTVWIDFFADHPCAHAARLRDLIAKDMDLCVCGVILAETLQGIRSDTEYRKTKDYFSDLIFFQMSRETFLLSADLYRILRKKGVTVRKPVDCMIAAVAMEHGLWLLHNDRDFDNISKHSNLKIMDATP